MICTYKLISKFVAKTKQIYYLICTRKQIALDAFISESALHSLLTMYGYCIELNSHHRFLILQYGFTQFWFLKYLTILLDQRFEI